MGDPCEIDEIDVENSYPDFDHWWREFERSRTSRARVDRGIDSYYGLGRSGMEAFDRFIERLTSGRIDLDAGSILPGAWRLSMRRDLFQRFASEMGISIYALSTMLEDLHDIRTETSEYLMSGGYEQYVRFVIPPHNPRRPTDSSIRRFARELKRQCSQRGYTFVHLSSFPTVPGFSLEDVMNTLRDRGFSFHELDQDHYEVFYTQVASTIYDSYYYDPWSSRLEMRQRSTRSRVVFSDLDIPQIPRIPPTIPLEDYCFEFEER